MEILKEEATLDYVTSIDLKRAATRSDAIVILFAAY